MSDNEKAVAEKIAKPKKQTKEASESKQKALRVRLYFPMMQREEFFLLGPDDAVPVQVQEFLAAFQQGIDAVWTPNPNKQRGYRVRDVSAYEADVVMLDMTEVEKSQE